MVTGGFIAMVVIAGIVWFQSTGNTTFEEVLEEEINERDEITDIILEYRAEGKTLWATIEDREMIDTILSEQSSVALQRTLSKKNGPLEYTIHIHNGFQTYSFEFDHEHFINGRNHYTIDRGSLVDSVEESGDKIEWETTDEFIGAE